MNELYDKQFNKVLDGYLQTGVMAAEDYDGLTRPQKTVIQTIKRSFARIKNNK